MKVAIDIIDSQCSLRRRHLAIRAERHVVSQGRADVLCKVRDYAGVQAWFIDEVNCGVIDIHFVVLHASEGEDEWRRLILRLAARQRETTSGQIRVLTFSGGNAQSECFETFDDVAGERYVADATSWWKHSGNVRARRDCGSALAEAVCVGLELDRPPIESWLVAGLRTHDEECDATTQTRLPNVRQAEELPERRMPHGLRHTLVNAVGPLCEALDFAMATGSQVPNLEDCWAYLRRRTRDIEAPSWIAALIVECERDMLPRIAQGDKRESCMQELRSRLAQIEGFAASLDRGGATWDSLEGAADMQNRELLRVLWIEDEEAWYQALNPAFSRFGIELTYCGSVNALPEPDQLESFDAIVVDLILEGQGDITRRVLEDRGISLCEAIGDENAGLGILQIVQALPLPPPVFVLSARESPSVVRACTVLGARNYFVKGRGDYAHLIIELCREAQATRERHLTVLRPRNTNLIVGDTTDPLSPILALCDRIASSRSRGPVMLFGEPGVGKGELAREIYLRSERRSKPFVVIDCSRLTPTLIESELFGHKGRSFTGSSTADKRGLIELADGGVAFIDELDKLDVSLQKNLLRVIAEGTTLRVGDTREQQVNVLLIIAANKDPNAKPDRGAFSGPLISRIGTYVFRIPPLRERGMVMPALSNALCSRVSDELGCGPRHLLPDALEWLTRQANGGSFDNEGGNIRGLRNLIERALVYSTAVDIGAGDIKFAATQKQAIAPASDAVREAARLAADQILGAGRAVLKDVKDEFEAELLRELITKTDRQRVAVMLGTSDQNLRQSIKKLRDKGLWSWEL